MIGLISVSLAVFSVRATAESLVLSTADTPPYSTEQNTGLYDRLVVAAFERIGHEVTIVRRPSGRSLTDAISGAVDGEYARIAEVARESESLVRVPEPLGDFEFVAFARSPTLLVKTWAELSDLHVAHIEGWRIFESNVKEYSSLTLVPDEELLFGLLHAGRVDVALYERYRGNAYLERNNIGGVRALPPPLAVEPMYLYLNRRNADLVDPLSDALQALRLDGTVAELEASAFGASAGRR